MCYFQSKPTPQGQTGKQNRPLDTRYQLYVCFYPLSHFLKAASRGILDVRSVEEKRKKKEKLEKQIATSGPPPAGGLRVSIKIYLKSKLTGMF